MEALKRELKDVNWIRLGIQAITAITIIFGMLWGFAETKGSNLFAPRAETAQEIRELRDMAIQGKTQVQKLSSELEDLRHETQDSFQTARKEQSEFWAEQRSVNREILQRLPPR